MKRAKIIKNTMIDWKKPTLNRAKAANKHVNLRRTLFSAFIICFQAKLAWGY